VTAQKPGGCLVKFGDFEEAITEGETLEEAAFNTADSISKSSVSLWLRLVLPMHLKMHWDTRQHCLRLRAQTQMIWNWNDVLSGIMAYRLEHNQSVPEPSAGKLLACPSAAVPSAMLLRQARGDRPLADMARALQTSWAAAQRLEDPHHWPSLNQLDRAASFLGKRLVLSLE